jgi:hypothetical protein
MASDQWLHAPQQIEPRNMVQIWGNPSSALDFTFQNQAAEARNILQNWSIEPELNAGSDHHATFATLGGGEDKIINMTEAKLQLERDGRDKFH